MRSESEPQASNPATRSPSEPCGEVNAPSSEGSRIILSWPIGPSKPLHGLDDVHVWCADLDDPRWNSPNAARSLSRDEWGRADRFHFVRDRERFIAARALLRSLLARYLVTQPKKIAFQYEAHGKPILVGNSGRVELHFNVSHSENLGAFALARGSEVGIDVELLRSVPEMKKIASDYFSRAELKALESLPKSRQSIAFLRAWTRREAVLKATGEGIGSGLDQIEVPLDANETAIVRRPPSGAMEHWAVLEIRPATGFIGAVAVRNPSAKIECWRWSRTSEYHSPRLRGARKP